ncbi:DUF4376 domain-containing protein [Pseudomonas sp. RT6P73]
MWALIENGTVAETTDIDPVGRYHASMLWLACPAEVAAGWGWDGERFVAPVAESRDLIKARVWAAIKAERDRRKEAGFQVGVQWVHSDLFSRSQWLGLKDNARDALAAGGGMGDALRDSEDNPVVWKMLDGSFVAVTAQLAFDVVATVTRSDIAMFTAAEVHNATMLLSADPARYDYTSDWPPSYAEWAAAQGTE